MSKPSKLNDDKGIVYCNRVLVGNWYEASKLEEVSLSRSLVKRKPLYLTSIMISFHLVNDLIAQMNVEILFLINNSLEYKKHYFKIQN